MGVDYYVCDNCGDTFCDAGPFGACEHCDNMMCPSCCAKFDVGTMWCDFADEELTEEAREEYEMGYDQCPFCCGKVTTDEQLFDFALKKLGLSREQLLSQFHGEQG